MHMAYIIARNGIDLHKSKAYIHSKPKVKA